MRDEVRAWPVRSEHEARDDRLPVLGAPLELALVRGEVRGHERERRPLRPVLSPVLLRLLLFPTLLSVVMQRHPHPHCALVPHHSSDPKASGRDAHVSHERSNSLVAHKDQ